MFFFFFFPLHRLLPNQFQSARCRCCFLCGCCCRCYCYLPSTLLASEFNHSMNESENRIKTNSQRRRLILSTAQCSASFWQQVVSKKQNQSIYKTILMFIFSSLFFFHFFSFVCLSFSYQPLTTDLFPSIWIFIYFFRLFSSSFGL